ncbi:hypothetical protein ASF61_11395 [Duganella sp. Leaf126]|uniref:glycosyltransferase family 2 protein n=1 Tax=Duganella sp. Leaf126 TaxID=1736266 RepID=UPI0006FBF7BE|nr:glycosyltransferase [Duganella sp. Leaf126]KQQ33657.1 hypothetical protein ASF61_11395 [Duganella sp. Leaf126]
MTASFSISIIVPAYNAAGFIDDCLAHIVQQMGPAHELIVIDDGSRDDTAARVQAQAAAAPHCALRLIRQANQGVAEVRNVGLQQARGNYILFIDSDDLLQPGVLDRIDAAIDTHAPDVITTDFCFWHPYRADQPLEATQLSYPANVVLHGQDAILAPYFADRRMYAWSKIVRRQIYLDLGLPLFPSGRLFEDMAALPRVLAACSTLVYLPLVLLHYRQHALSITHMTSPRWCTDYVLALASAKPHLARAGVSARVRTEFDGAACLFYLCAIKTSFGMPASDETRQLRAALHAIFLDGLFGTLDQALHNLEAGKITSLRLRDSRRIAHQVRQALAGSKWFELRQTVNRAYKTWQLTRQQRLHQAN